MSYPIARVINLIRPDSQRLWSLTEVEAQHRLLSPDTDAVLEIDGSFALVAQEGERVVLARSLDRPLRYFLAKAVSGPVLALAERIDGSRWSSSVEGGPISSTRATAAWYPRIT